MHVPTHVIAEVNETITKDKILALCFAGSIFVLSHEAIVLERCSAVNNLNWLEQAPPVSINRVLIAHKAEEYLRAYCT